MKLLPYSKTSDPANTRPARSHPETLTPEKLLERFPDIFDLPTQRQNLRRLRHWIETSRSKSLTRSGRRSEVPGNGLARAIIRHGKLIYVDVSLFLEWFNAGRGRG
jgi:hypothetical protein